MVLRFFICAITSFFLSCGDIERDNPNDPGSSKYRGYLSVVSSSSSKVSSSSSVALSSSSQASSSSVAISSSRGVSSSSVVLSSSSFASSSSVELSSSSIASSSSVVPSSSSRASSSSAGLCAGFVDGTEREHYGKNKAQFCDSRDGKKYVYVTIGTQTWMAENLNTSGGKCYNNSESNCTTYGKLYDWATAMAISTSCNTSALASGCTTTIVTSKHRGICPSGWHLPSDAEWNTLMKAVNPSCNDNDLYCFKVETLLTTDTNGLGFAALSGGSGGLEGEFGNIGSYGIWWSASEASYIYAYGRQAAGTSVGRKDYNKRFLFSVRCVKD